MNASQTMMTLGLALVAITALTLAAATVQEGDPPQEAVQAQGISPDQVFRLPPRPTPTPARELVQDEALAVIVPPSARRPRLPRRQSPRRPLKGPQPRL